MDGPYRLAMDGEKAGMRRRWLAGALIAALGLWAYANALAQNPGTSPAPTPGTPTPTATEAANPALPQVQVGGGIPTVKELFLISPYINGALAGLSVIASTLFLYLLLTVSTSSFMPAQFMDDVTRLIIGRQFDQAVHLCQNHRRTFAASVIQRGIENRDKDPSVMIAVQHAEGRRRAERVWSQIGYLGEIANIAPMLGLLGTVVGMIKAFFTLDTRTPSIKSTMLAQSIAEAMGTTMFGLIVALAAGVFYTILRGRATRALTDVEQSCQTLADHTFHAAADPRLREIDELARKAKARAVAGSTPGSARGREEDLTVGPGGM